MEFRNLRADEIDLRIGQVKAPKGNAKGGFSLLLYQDARCGMNILDETVGVENWQCEYYEVKGNLFCRVGICIPRCDSRYNEELNNQIAYQDYGEWVWKSDCGTESNTEAIKGESSDAFKRAVVRFGIGRELYTAPFIWVVAGDDMFDGTKLTYQVQKQIAGFRVSDIEYAGKNIISLTIVDKDGSVVFTWKQK